VDGVDRLVVLTEGEGVPADPPAAEHRR
jgi:hypothetical protein